MDAQRSMLPVVTGIADEAKRESVTVLRWQAPYQRSAATPGGAGGGARSVTPSDAQSHTRGTWRPCASGTHTLHATKRRLFFLVAGTRRGV